MGMRLQDLAVYGSFLQFARSEVELVHDRIIHRDTDEKHQSLKDIQMGLEKVKNLLTAKAYREFFINHGLHEGIEKGGN